MQRVAVSHGFNVVTLLRSRGKADGTAVRLGAGIIVAHPESTVRGRELPENGGILGLGYVVAGPALQAAVVGHAGRGRPQALGEAKLVGAFAHVPVAGGSADMLERERVRAGGDRLSLLTSRAARVSPG